METEVEVQVKTTPTPSPPPLTTVRGQTAAVEKRGSPVLGKDSLRRGSGRKGSSLRRDQLTGEKRRSRTGSLGSLIGYEAKYPVSCE